MAKAKKVLSTVLAALMVVFTVAGYVPAKAAVVPQIKIVEQPKAEYKVGERMYTKVQCANFSGKVEYRATLWDGSEKKTIEVWKTYPYYYKTWQPTGKTVLPITWIVEKPGVYNLTVYVRPVGSKVPYSTYAKSANFTVLANDKVESLQPVADVTVNQGEVAKLPETVKANMADKTVVDKKVTWDAVDTSKPGEYTVNGTVEGTDLKATVKVIVKEEVLTVKSVSAITNAKLKITLDSAAKSVVYKSAITVADKDGKAVEVTSVSQTVDNKTVYVSTAAMVAGEIYTVNVTGKEFKVVAKPAITDKLEVLNAVSNNNVAITVQFSVNVDPATALNAANYAIDNDLKVTEVKKGATADTVVLTTSTQVAGKLYKVTVSNVLAENGNALDSTKNYAYFGGKAKDEVKPTAIATAKANTKFVVTFTDSSDLDEASVLNPANYVVSDLKVVAVAYDVNPDGTPNKKQVIVTTESQTAGKLYTVTLNNIADIFGNVIKADTKVYFGGVAKDTVKPIAVAQSLSNTQVKVTFTDSSDIDKASAETIANYVIDGLTVVSAEQDGSDVILTTSAQTAGKLYTMTINNVADEYGNVIKADTKVYFGGKAVDTTAPTYVAQALSQTSVRVVFSDSIDKTTVVPYNFYIKDLGYAVAAKLESDGKTVTLTTLKQTSGKIYTIEVRNVKNTDGTAVNSDSKATFAGMGSTSAVAPTLLAAVPVDSYTLVLTFDQNLAVKPSTVAIKNYSTGALIQNAVTINWKGNSRTEVIATLGAPMAEGSLYNAEAVGAIGANGIALNTSYDEVTFAGVTIAQTGASILTAQAINNNTIKVYFDKPVALNGTASAVAATIGLFAADGTTTVKYADTTAAVGQNVLLSSDGKEMTIYFYKSGTTLSLTEGNVYTLKFTDLAKIQTVSGSKNLLADTTGGSFATMQFGAVSTPVAGPEILAAVAQSKYVVDIVFDRPIAYTAADEAAIAATLTVDGTNMPVAKNVRILDDEKTVRVYFNETGKTAFVEGAVYTVIYTPTLTAYFNDAADTNLKAVVESGIKKIPFAALGNVADGPAISAIAAVNANTINVTLDQETTGIAANNVTILDKDGSDLLGKFVIVPGTYNDSFKVVRTDGIFEAGQSYTIILLAGMKDVSGLRTADATAKTVFGGIGNANLKLTGLIAGGTLSIVLKDSANADVNGKELRCRVTKDLNTATTLDTATKTTVTGAAAWTLTNSETGEMFVVEATDGSVAITVIQ